MPCVQGGRLGAVGRGGVLLAVAVLLTACGAQRSGPMAVSPNPGIRRILVLPFINQARLRGENATFRCSLCNTVLTTGSVADGAAPFVTEQVVRLLSRRPGITLLGADWHDAPHAQRFLDDGTGARDLALLLETARHLGADTVLTGSVYRFEQRQGTGLAAQSPASVGIHLDLVDAATGRVLWQAKFDETQQYLTDNLLKIGTFIKRGGKWVTAEQLAVTGLEVLLERSTIP